MEQEKRKRGIHLRTKFMLASLGLAVALCAALVAIAYSRYSAEMLKLYEQRMLGVVDTAARLIPKDKMRGYIEQAAQSGKPQSLKDDTYMELREQFRILFQENGLVWLYAIHPTPEGAYTLVEGGEIGDRYYCELGDFSPVGEGYTQEEMDLAMGFLAADKLGDEERVFESRDNFGHLVTAFATVSDAQGPYLIVAADISVASIDKELHEYLWVAVITAVLILGCFLSAYLLYLHRGMIDPLQKLVDSAVVFVSKGNRELKEMNVQVNTRDEIEDLADAFNRMTRDIISYIDDLNAATAERERIGAELRIATTIQASMLPNKFPAFPERKEFDIYATMDPAKEVGGDFYDFFLVDEDHLCVVVADVSGKGVPAALFMVNAKTAIKDRLLSGLTPAETFTQVNTHLCENNEAEMFVTALMAVLEISTGKLTVVNAGHNPPLCKAPGGAYAYERLKAGFVLAGMEGVRYRQSEMELAPGGALFFYTDGVTEATDAQEQLFGEERLERALNAAPNAAPEALLHNVKTALADFVQEAPQFDDITMLCLAYKGTKEGL